ncbi:type II restriction endonuclease [Commensalibacter melissae]|uniref:type II restriction endonuclease n=1 Tax=Commensalibacter melissae TaxID=2070537 RepID=UPI0018C2B222|nr:type II restriction endonuclease [Commensalibacter melissae]
MQRRKARSGRSLELHLREIFLEEKLKEGLNFSYQPETENGKRPDFVFPCENAYKNKHFLSKQLRMLAVKTTCKDRWRQILNEADRMYPS